jgi:hypothetical protein
MAIMRIAVSVALLGATILVPASQPVNCVVAAPNAGQITLDGSPMPLPKPIGALVADGSPMPLPKPIGTLVADGSPMPLPKPLSVLGVDGSPMPLPKPVGSLVG